LAARLRGPAPPRRSPRLAAARAAAAQEQTVGGR